MSQNLSLSLKKTHIFPTRMEFVGIDASKNGNCPAISNMLEHVAQISLSVAGTYDTHNSVSHGRNENSDEAHNSVSHDEISSKNLNARSHDEDLASANDSFRRFLGSYSNHGVTCDGATDGPNRITMNGYYFRQRHR